MINAYVETKDIQLQKSHMHTQVTWMGKKLQNVSSCTRILMPFIPIGNNVIKIRLAKFQTCTSLSSHSSLYKVY